MVREITQHHWNTLLDGATGTGDIIIRVLAHGNVAGRTIRASDTSQQMLAIASKQLKAHRSNVSLVQPDMQSMPSIPESSIDAYAISLGLKICDRSRALREAYRILRPGGRLIALEASNIPRSALHTAYLSYMALCMPVVGWIATGGDASACRYLLDGIRDFPSAEELAEEMSEVGFVEVEFQRLSLGIVAIPRQSGLGGKGRRKEFAIITYRLSTAAGQWSVVGRLGIWCS